MFPNSLFLIFVLNNLFMAARSGPIQSIPNINGPLTPHFIDWLNTNNYGNYSFARLDLSPTKGSYGGKRSDDDIINNRPIVFIHGNSDGALAIPGNYSSGWSYSIQNFLKEGYTEAELYTTTWGNRDPNFARFRGHTCEYLLYLRKFVDAVFEYTKAREIDVISHSMGVTLTRRIIKGGLHFDDNGLVCNLGVSLSGSVNTFIGIAGANYGMCTCATLENDFSFPTCSGINGFWPGDPCLLGGGCGNMTNNRSCPNDHKYSLFLTRMNVDTTFREGKYVISTWSNADDILMNKCQVYGRSTSLIPTSSCYKVYNGYTHMETKEKTAKDQYRMIVHHVCN